MINEIKKVYSLMNRMGMIIECSELLLEAMSVSDVYSKYYSNDINEEDFNKIVQADPTTPANGSKAGRFVKWLMNLYKANNLKLEDLYKASEYLELFVKFNAKLPEGTKDINRYKSLPELFHIVKDFQENPDQATSKSDERRKIKSDEAELFYEDDMWKVVIPKTEAAACEYGKHTQWCTAALKNNMFDHYNNDGPLYILINKKNGRKYQFHFESEQFMDENDEEVDIIETGLTPKLWDKFTETPYTIMKSYAIQFKPVIIDNFIVYKSLQKGLPYYLYNLNNFICYIILDNGVITDMNGKYISSIFSGFIPQVLIDELIERKYIRYYESIVKTNDAIIWVDNPHLSSYFIERGEDRYKISLNSGMVYKFETDARSQILALDKTSLNYNDLIAIVKQEYNDGRLIYDENNYISFYAQGKYVVYNFNGDNKETTFIYVNNGVITSCSNIHGKTYKFQPYKYPLSLIKFICDDVVYENNNVIVIDSEDDYESFYTIYNIKQKNIYLYNKRKKVVTNIGEETSNGLTLSDLDINVKL